jgi:polyphenol oxidase
MLTHPSWTAIPDLRHGFLDRSECGNGIEWREAVRRAGTALPIVTPRQVHGTAVVTAAADRTPEADGLVTGARGLLVGIVTADCVPVLLLARERRVAAAVHAGWRGAVNGVLEASLAHLRDAFGVEPRDIEAAIGPAVSGCCYEVGPEVEQTFRARSGAVTASAWCTRGGRRFLDLRQAVARLLAAAGVDACTTFGPCTVCGASYFSYRRDGTSVGRQLSFIGWA